MLTKFCLIILIIFISFSNIYAQKSGVQHWKSKEILGSIGLVTALNGPSNSWYPFGTGVLVDIDSTYPHIFFITNRHIYIARDTFRIQLNTYSENNNKTHYKQRILYLSKSSNAFVPQTKDSDFVAILVDRPKEDGFLLISPSDVRFTTSLKYGDDVEFYGFPFYSSFGMDKAEYQFPILRSGVISFFAYDNSVDELLPSMFLVDGVSYGGGSGSPVFSKKAIITDSSTIAFERKFIGIISGHFPLSRPVGIKPKFKINDSTASDSTANDSIFADFAECFTKNYEFKYEQNYDLAIVISSDILHSYIRHNYTKLLKQTYETNQK